MRVLKPNPIPDICSFCQQKMRWSDAAIKKPGIAICKNCVRAFFELLKDPVAGELTEPFHECLFCGFLRSPMPPFREIFDPSAMSSEQSFQELEDIYNNLSPGHKTSAFEPVGTRLFRGVDCAICDECIALCEKALNP